MYNSTKENLVVLGCIIMSIAGFYMLNAYIPDMIKVVSVVFDSLLLLILSMIFSNKFKSSMPSSFSYFLGIIMLAISYGAAGYYSLFGSVFSLNGKLQFYYLASIFILISLLCLISCLKYKSNVLKSISIVSLLLAIIFVLVQNGILKELIIIIYNFICNIDKYIFLLSILMILSLFDIILSILRKNYDFVTILLNVLYGSIFIVCLRGKVNILLAVSTVILIKSIASKFLYKSNGIETYLYPYKLAIFSLYLVTFISTKYFLIKDVSIFIVIISSILLISSLLSKNNISKINYCVTNYLAILIINKGINQIPLLNGLLVIVLSMLILYSYLSSNNKKKSTMNILYTIYLLGLFIIHNGIYDELIFNAVTIVSIFLINLIKDNTKYMKVISEITIGIYLFNCINILIDINWLSYIIGSIIIILALWYSIENILEKNGSKNALISVVLSILFLVLISEDLLILDIYVLFVSALMIILQLKIDKLLSIRVVGIIFIIISTLNIMSLYDEISIPLFIFVIGVVITIIAVKSKEKKPKVVSVGFNYCSNCKAIINDGEKFCSACGNEVNPHINYCPECGIKVENDYRYCPECQTKLK